MKKKIFLFLMAAILSWPMASAQPERVHYGVFNHLGLGFSFGTDGLGFDVATPLTDYVGLRAGISFFPKLSYDTNIDIKDNNPLITPDVDIKATLNVFDFKVLADLYPFGKNSSFHLTGGLFMGKEDFVTATNTSMFIKDPSKYGKLGLMLGDYRITTDKDGYVKADMTVNKMKPYVGLGFGRAVPKKNVNVSCDLGVMFWGEPRLGANTIDDWGNESYHRFKYSELDEYDDDDLKDFLKNAEKITVYPVLNIRINGRIF